MCPNCNVKVKSIEHKSKAYWKIKGKKESTHTQMKIKTQKTLRPNMSEPHLSMYVCLGNSNELDENLVCFRWEFVIENIENKCVIRTCCGQIFRLIFNFIFPNISANNALFVLYIFLLKLPFIFVFDFETNFVAVDGHTSYLGKTTWKPSYRFKGLAQ